MSATQASQPRRACPACENPVPQTERTCSRCGEVLVLGAPARWRRRRKGRGINAFAIVVVVVAMVIAAMVVGYIIYLGEREVIPTVPEPAVETRERDEQEQREGARRALEFAAQHGDTDYCWRAESEDRSTCEALISIAHKGRSTPRQRKTLRKYLKAQGYRKISGYIVGRHDEGLYEAAFLKNIGFGTVIPGSRHFLLLTSLTDYQSKGRFSLWAIEGASREIITTSGFVQTWRVFTETPVGSVVEQVFKAEAGASTKRAATRTLKALMLKDQ